MNKSSLPGVIVMGGHVQGLGILRVFGENKIPVVLIDETSLNITRFSKYCLRFYKYRKPELFSFLKELSHYPIYKDWLLIPTNDFQVKILSQNRDYLSRFFKVSTDKWESVSLCYNKKNTYQVAMELGINIPKTFFPESQIDLENLDFVFPCIIKPAVMHEFYDRMKKKVFLCKDKSELIYYYKKALQIVPSNQIIVQEIIEGTGENQYSACFLYLNGQSVSYLTARRKRQHPIDFGNATTFAEIVEAPELLEIGERLLKKINYNGVCEVEFKKDSKDGIYKFLEINPRSWKWHLISQKCGIPFLMNLYKYYYNQPYLNNNKPDILIGWRHFITDFPTVLVLRSKRQYQKSDTKYIQHATWDSKDILPSIIEIILLPILFFKR